MPWNSGGPNPWGTPPGGGGGPKTPGPDGEGEKRRGERPNSGSGPRPGPWGNGARPQPGSGSPVDLDQLIANVQAYLRRSLPGGGGRSPFSGRGGGWLRGGRGLALLLIVVAAVWLGSGFYRVEPDEQGVVLRFGAFDRTAPPGLNYHIPWPVEQVMLPAVTRINRAEIGYRSGGPDLRTGSARDLPIRDVPEESLMLTGDENIIDIDFAVFWRVSDAATFLFNTRNPEIAVKSVAESVMREVIGRTPIQPALTDARAQIEQSVLHGAQAILDQYGTGVEITQVQLQKVDPPAAVIDSFRDVQRANTEAERMVNQAQSYRNDVVPRARGDAARITAAADGERQGAIAEATGQAQRFDSVLAAYQAARDVTLKRLYIETMEGIMARTPSVVVDERIKGLVPFLPLGDAVHASPIPGQPAPPVPGPAAAPRPAAR